MSKFHTLTENYPRFQGGFIWDWSDKCLIAKTADNQEYFAYGGDFGESVTDLHHPKFMTCNGIVLPDLTPKSVACEVKQVYCPIIIERIDYDSAWSVNPGPERLRIKNRNLTQDSSIYKVIYQIRENGYIITTGIYDLPCLKAGETADIEFIPEFERKADAEYHIEYILQYAVDTPYAEKGFELGHFQFELEQGFYIKEDSLHTEHESLYGKLKVSSEANQIRISNELVSITFDTSKAVITSYEKNGTQYLQSGPIGCFARPHSGMDVEGWGYHQLWKNFDVDNISILEYSIEQTDTSRLILTFISELSFKHHPNRIKEKTVYTILPDGTITVNALFFIDKAFRYLSRTGMELILPQGFEDITYYGLGPVENYNDRKSAAMLGV